MMALAAKTGRRPSMAERPADYAMDAVEFELTFGKPAFQIALMCALFVECSCFEETEAARRVIKSNLRARGLTAQRLFCIAERGLHHLQPTAVLFPGLDHCHCCRDQLEMEAQMMRSSSAKSLIYLAKPAH